MEKPNFEVVKDQALHSFLEYIWKRIERIENPSINYIGMVPTGEWKKELQIYMAGAEGTIPKEWNQLMKDFVEHNSNPSGSEGAFLKRITVDA